MTRTETALVALLALAALALAAGGFAPVDDPNPGDGGDAESPAETPIADDAAATPGPANGTDSAPGDSSASAGGGSEGGLSPLALAGFAGALVSCVGVGIVLTGDDDRVPPPAEADAEQVGASPVTASYGPVPDLPAVEAWRRLADAADAEDTETPGETARRATRRGFPDDAVARVTARFRAVRYGGDADASGSAGDPASDEHRPRQDRQRRPGEVEE